MAGLLVRIFLIVTVFVGATVAIERQRSERFRSEFVERMRGFQTSGLLRATNPYTRVGHANEDRRLEAKLGSTS